MTYCHTIVYTEAPLGLADGLIASLPPAQLHHSLDTFLRAVAGVRYRSLFLLLAGPTTNVPALVRQTLSATDWGRSGLRHFISVGALHPSPKEIVAAFREGCDGYIPLPATPSQVRRGLPREVPRGLQAGPHPVLEGQVARPLGSPRVGLDVSAREIR